MVNTGRNHITRALLIVAMVVQIALTEENLAVGKVATQKSVWLSHTADHAVDGCLSQNVGNSGCCSKTEFVGNTTWWRVDLGQLSTVEYITITYNDDFAGENKRVAGYRLYLSNTTDEVTSGVLCYEDKSSTAEEVPMNQVTIQCPYIARYVVVYNFRNDPMRHAWYDVETHMTLCEVQVFGCDVGKYGNGNCDQTCSVNCNGGNCNVSAGACFECSDGLHGETCSMPCSEHCLGNQCYQGNGTCPECKSGWHGDSCTTMCDATCTGNSCRQSDGWCEETLNSEANTLVVAVVTSFCILCLGQLMSP